jgi:hypothetical protein
MVNFAFRINSALPSDFPDNSGLPKQRFVGHWATLTHFTEESRKTDLFFNLQMDIHQLQPLLVQKYYLLQQG